jgi:hypothetical protein
LEAQALSWLISCCTCLRQRAAFSAPASACCPAANGERGRGGHAHHIQGIQNADTDRQTSDRGAIELRGVSGAAQLCMLWLAGSCGDHETTALRRRGDSRSGWVGVWRRGRSAAWPPMNIGRIAAAASSSCSTCSVCKRRLIPFSEKRRRRRGGFACAGL